MQARSMAWLGLVSAGVLFAACPLKASAQTESGEKIYQRTLRGTTWIVIRQGNGMSSGTGALIANDGTRKLVLTNYHVTGDDDHIQVLFPIFNSDDRLLAERSRYMARLSEGKGFPARVLYRDQRRDLALLELKSVPAGAHVIRLARQSPSPGQRVHSIGNPGKSGALWLYTSGTVRQVYEKQWRTQVHGSILTFAARVVETQSPTNPGDSGGPLVDDRGDLVGVTQGMAVDASLLSLFIDVTEVRSFLASHRLLDKLPPARASTTTETAAKTQPKPEPMPEDKEKDAAQKLTFAKTLAQEGKLVRARERYEEIVEKFPMTKAATEAKSLLDKLNK